MTAPALRGRLAPSPTGALHLGNARTFLVTWLSCRAQGGRMLLRVEDLDHPRVKPHAVAELYEDLRWLGLDWDEGPDRGGPCGPYVQTERRGLYRQALDRLRAQGLAYPCTCSRKDAAAAASAPHAGEEGPRYPGTCRGRWPDYAAAQAALPPGRSPAWRLRAADREVCFDDGFHGRQCGNVARSCGDFAFARAADGAGYQLAVVVDDAAMGVTEVVRGDDLLPSTHRQLLLYEALGLPAPRFVHVPLVVGPDARRLAKRHGDTRLSRVRAAGVRPERVVGLLASWCGWTRRGEELSAADLVDRFDLGTLPHAPIVYTDADRAFLGL